MRARPILRLLVPGIIFLVSTWLYFALEHEMIAEKEDWFDARVFNFLKDYLTPGVLELFRSLTFFGSAPFLMAAFAITIICLLIVKRKKEALALTLTGAGSFVLLEGFKFIFKRIRPDKPYFRIPKDYSFPSGHAFHSFIFYSILVLLIWKTNWDKKWKIVISIALFLFVLLIGLSRIVLRYHFSSDVVAGFCLGCSCLMAYLLIREIRARRLNKLNTAV